MLDDVKSKEELLERIAELRKRVSQLVPQPNQTVDEAEPVSAADEVLNEDYFQELTESHMPRRINYGGDDDDATESIDLQSLFVNNSKKFEKPVDTEDVDDEDATESINLKTLFTADLSTSGSFNVRGSIWATTFGKVVQALPIPAFLIDERLEIAVANQACMRLSPAYERIQGKPFASLSIGPIAAERTVFLLQQVFEDRKPRVAEGTFRIEDTTIWGRMTFRAIRIATARFVLLLVEDLTHERIQLRENEILRQELEKRVEQRTMELRRANASLRQEVTDRKNAERELEKVIAELQQALAQVKKLSGLLPICASCKKIRNDKGYWQQTEQYISEHSEALFSHGLCPECAKELYPEFIK